MSMALIGGMRWSPGTGLVPNRSVVVDGDRIVALDADPVEGCEIVPVGAGVVVPGFVDAHVHPQTGGMRLITCDLTHVTSRAEAERTIASHARALPAGAWMTGGGWQYDWFDHGCPTADLLDRLVPDRPALLEVRDGHSTWANSTALRLAGVDAGTPDPPDGRIERNRDGSPQGTLHEGAMRLVEAAVPPPDRTMLDRALEVGIAHLHSKGVTAWQDAWVSDLEHPSYLGASNPSAVIGALWWDRSRGLEQVEEIVERSRERASGYRPGAVKLMLDGVCENFTAAMLTPYVGAHGGAADHSGIDFIPPEVVARAVTALDAAGFQCHFHAIGDRAVRSALDGVEAARRENGWSGAHHHVAHLQVVDPEDVPRFAQLRVAANCQPLWACNEPAMTELTIPFLGPDRSAGQYPFRSLLRTGALVAMGSDWPVSTADVMDQVSVAIRRRPPRSDREEVFHPDERLTLDQALTAFTLGSARLNGWAGRGRIRVGNVADLVLLAGDPFSVPDPAGIPVARTIVAGRSVFEREGSG